MYCCVLTRKTFRPGTLKHASSGLLSTKCFSSSSNSSFPEPVVRPLLKKAIKNVGDSWGMTSSHIKKTILETLQADAGDSTNNDTTSSNRPILLSPVAVVESCTSKFDVHPILGELVHDMGYKRIYKANILCLINATVWEKQRTLRHERAQLIASDKIKSESLSYMPGIITCYHHVPSGNIGKLSLVLATANLKRFVYV